MLGSGSAQVLVASPLLWVFALIALGSALGAVRWFGMPFGAGAVFFAGIIAGHFEVKIPHEVGELGLVLFVYSVGLHAAPHFVAAVRSGIGPLLVAGAAAPLIGAAVATGLAMALGIEPALAAGLFTGATTCTPALAGLVDMIERGGSGATRLAGIGYAIAYPFSVAASVLFVQSLPRLLRTSPEEAARRFADEQSRRRPRPEAVVLLLTNPSCAGRTLHELGSLQISKAVVSRIKRDGRILPATPDVQLALGDALLVVGPPDELARMEALIGEMSLERMDDPTGTIGAEQLRVARFDAAGKPLRDLGLGPRFGVTITRVRRGDIELTPTGETTLELGDLVRVVGPVSGIAGVRERIGGDEGQLDQTTILTFAVGVAVGLAIGQIPIHLGKGVQTRLGAAGGTFLAAILFGYLGRIGPLSLYVPSAARLVLRDLGLTIFLVAAGAGAGRGLWPVLREAGLPLALIGAAITLSALYSATLLMTLVLRWNMLSQGGAISAVQTQPAALAAAAQLTRSEAAPLAFATVYPIALISKLLLAQIVFELLRQWR